MCENKEKFFPWFQRNTYAVCKLKGNYTEIEKK